METIKCQSYKAPWKYLLLPLILQMKNLKSREGSDLSIVAHLISEGAEIKS